MFTFEELLKQARDMEASDIHLTSGLPPRARIGGELVDMSYPMLMPDDIESMVMGLQNNKQKQTFLETGQVDFAFSIAGQGRFRINMFKQRGSTACAIRIVGTDIPEPETLGIPKETIDLCSKKKGLILVTGPAGSGKSTTLASLIHRINDTRNSHIITLEDPIEYLHVHNKAMINQREIGLDTMSYASALKSAMHEDPDVIVVGELKDLETISTAITAAETGHLVLSTLYTVGAAATIDRIIDVFPKHQQQQIRIQLSMVLEAIISQQLIPAKNKKGRVAAYEIMYATAPVKSLIKDSKSSEITSFIQKSAKQGMITMDDALIGLCNRDEISFEDAVDYAQDITYIEKQMKLHKNI